MAATDPRQFWDARFAEAGFAYGTQPNDFLREQAASLPLGDSLCLAEGEGRNGVFLAELGHRVTVQDLSAVGLAKAQKLAAERGVRLETDCSDLQTFAPRPESTDLVVAIWMHLSPPLRARVLAQAISALRPGGHLILEAYSPRQLALGTGGPPTQELLVEPQQLRHDLAGLELLVLVERQRVVSEGPYHQGTSSVVQALGRKPGRREP
jgi:SAM-dependent methyltransferase